MEKEEEEDTLNVFKSLKPFGYFMKSFGLFAMSLKKSEFKSTPIDVIITVASLGVYAFLIATSLHKTDTFIVSSTSSIALASIWKISCVITVLSQVCMMVHQFWKIKEISLLINQIHNVDEMVIFLNLALIGFQKKLKHSMSIFKMKQLFITPNFRKNKLFICIFTVLVFIYNFVVSIEIPMMCYHGDILQLRIYMYTFSYMEWYMILFLLQFTFACFAIKSRLELLNSSLK